jgi:hypothetical protein
MLEIDRQRTLLSAQFELLEASQRRADAAAVRRPTNTHEVESEHFDDLDDDLSPDVTTHVIPCVTSPRPSETTVETVSPEKRPLIIPSTCLPSDHPLCFLELRFRESQANRYIIALQEVIAEKSFQYTNIIRVAPRKSVITRARTIITKLNHKISYYAKIYNRCRAALVRLRADDETLRKFRNLTKQDVKASSAIIDPNIPGSSSLRLSWIWQMSAADEQSPSHLRECILNSLFIKQYQQ